MRFAFSMNVTMRKGRTLDSLDHAYADFFRPFAIESVFVPNNVPDPQTYIAGLGVAGIVLTGGGDIEPALYHAPDRHALEVSAQRDATERALMDVAVEQRLPVIGICRGIQWLNVYFGGTLVQDIPTELEGALPHEGDPHPVTLLDTPVKDVMGVSQQRVNTFHHQGMTLDHMAADLVPFAVTEDGLIEGVLRRDLPVMGVQWHPERGGPSAEFDRSLVAHTLRRAFWPGQT